MRSSAENERLLIGEYQADGVRSRSIAVLRTRPLGRAGRDRTIGAGSSRSLPHVSVERLVPLITAERQTGHMQNESSAGSPGIATIPVALVEGVRVMWGLGGNGPMP